MSTLGGDSLLLSQRHHPSPSLTNPRLLQKPMQGSRSTATEKDWVGSRCQLWDRINETQHQDNIFIPNVVQKILLVLKSESHNPKPAVVEHAWSPNSWDRGRRNVEFRDILGYIAKLNLNYMKTPPQKQMLSIIYWIFNKNNHLIWFSVKSI